MFKEILAKILQKKKTPVRWHHSYLMYALGHGYNIHIFVTRGKEKILEQLESERDIRKNKIPALCSVQNQVVLTFISL